MVTFVTGHEDAGKDQSAIDWDVLARNPGTLVFLMGVKNLSEISEALIGHGKPPRTPAALIRWGTTPNQVSLFSTLEKIPEEARRRRIAAPAVLVVGSVVDLHSTLGWYEHKPLFGRSILITRSREQSRRMADLVASQAGRPILFPTIAIEPLEDFGPLDAAINRIETFDWIIFTSVNGVDHFFKRFMEVLQDVRQMAGPRIGAIGPITADAIGKRGLKVDVLAKEFKAEGVLAELSEQDVRGRRFLIPRAEKAREILPETLTAMGGEVEVVSVYRTRLPEGSHVGEIVRLLEQKEIDAVTFTSSSTVTHFVEMLGETDTASLLADVVMASIGPITSGTMREKGLPVHVEAAQYTIDGLLEALAEYFIRAKNWKVRLA
jgi:uroporphyrinogen III methyltransferase/synthase